MFRKKTPELPTAPQVYPPGSFIETEAGYFYIVNPSKRLRLTTKRALDSWAPHRVVATTEAAVGKYRVSSKMCFRNGSLLHNISDGKLYLIVNGKRCLIESPDVLARLGAKSSDAVTVSADETNLHEIGESLT